MGNWETTFVKIIKEICDEEKITLTSFDDWAFHLRKEERHGFIHGYQFGLDNGAVAAILKDKSAASEMMTAAAIPHVAHWCVMNPAHPEFSSLDSAWGFLEETLKQYRDLVVKDNQGTGGNLVFRVRNRQELEKACQEIFTTAPSLAVSPYLTILGEYRVVVLDRKIEVVFSKIRPHLTGDGVHTGKELLADAVMHATPAQMKELFSAEKYGGELLERELLETVIPEGEEVVLGWKHNLGQGAKAELVRDEVVLDELRPLVAQAVDLFDLRFVSVDIVRTEQGLKILEINSGVMMENLANTNEYCYNLAKETYRKAIFCMLE